MNRFPNKLIYALLAAASASLILVAIFPAQAKTTSPAPDEPLARAPASLSASALLTGTQPSPRYGHTLTRVGDAIYLFGGVDAVEQGAAEVMPMADVLNELWVFSSTTKLWTEVQPQGDAPAPRFGHAATSVDEATSLGKLFFFSGILNGGYEVRDQWLYDPVDNGWQQIIPENEGPNGLAGHSAVTEASGKPVIFGGASGSYMDTRVWRYNVDTNRWLKISEAYNNKLPRKWHFAATIRKAGQQYMVVVSGTDPNAQMLEDVWLFDFQTLQWTQILPLPSTSSSDARVSEPGPTGRAQMAGVAYGSRVLIMGGVDESGTELDEVWEFDVTLTHWRALPPLPAPRRLAAAAILEEREDQVDVLLFGGISNGQVISDTLVYTVDVPPTYTVYEPLVMRQ
jgi:hypothetical protein